MGLVDVLQSHPVVTDYALLDSSLSLAVFKVRRRYVGIYDSLSQCSGFRVFSDRTEVLECLNPIHTEYIQCPGFSPYTNLIFKVTVIQICNQMFLFLCHPPNRHLTTVPVETSTYAHSRF